MSAIKAMSAPPSGTPVPQENIEEKTPVPNIDSSELYTVDRPTETVAGQLENYSDFDSPLMKRYAQQGQEKASQRGLTNSSIAAGSGMARVLDKAGEFATTDAGIYNARKNENMRTATQRYTTDQTVEANKYGSDKQLEGQVFSSILSSSAQRYGADQQLTGQKYSSDQQLKGTELSAEATLKAAEARANATVAASYVSASSNEKIQASRAEVDMKKIQAETVLRKMDADDRIKAASVLAETNRAAAARGATNNAITSAGNSYSAAVANINIEASGNSQKEQLSRIQQTYDTQITAIDSMSF